MSTFDEILAQVLDLLQREGRVSYRALKICFNLDDEYIEGLKDELIAAKRLASDEQGKVLVWTGGTAVASSQLPVASSPPPVSYTPKHLAAHIRAEGEALEARGATEGERKTITALFADMAGFTALAHDLDPEDTRHLIDPVLKLMMDAVHRYEGYVAQSLGDGIFALFGAPIAHETTRDVVGLDDPIARCLTRTGRRERGWDGGQLAMTQDARNDCLLGDGGNDPECATTTQRTPRGPIQSKHVPQEPGQFIERRYVNYDQRTRVAHTRRGSDS